MSNLAKRSIFGALYVALMVCSILFWEPYFFIFVFSLIAYWMTFELGMILETPLSFNILMSLASVYLFNAVFAALTGWWLADIALVCLGLYIVTLLAYILLDLMHTFRYPISLYGTLGMGQVWVAFPLTMMAVLYNYSPWTLLALFIIIWTNDTGAYCAGSLFGKHKLAPSLSPGKTIEGFLGGAVLATVVGTLYLADPLHLLGIHYTWLEAMIVSVLLVIFGTLGDLTESSLKRNLHIKDTGNIIPGHGGLLDRFDSALMAAPVFAIVEVFLRYYVHAPFK